MGHFTQNEILNMPNSASSLVHDVEFMCSFDYVTALKMAVQTETVYTDQAKAFDLVWHEQLLLNLEKYDITGSLLN